MVDLRVWNTSRRGLTAGSLMTYFRPARFQAAFPWLLALLAVGYIALHWSDPVTLAPDSGGYLQFSEHRTSGYPLFLNAVEALLRHDGRGAESATLNSGSGVRLPGLERPPRLSVPILCAGSGRGADAVSPYRRPARLHLNGVSLHLAAVPVDWVHRALGPPARRGNGWQSRRSPVASRLRSGQPR